MKTINLKTKQALYLKLLIYGASGVGKTMSIKTLPEKGTLVLTTEPQTPVRLAGTGYECIEIESWNDIYDDAYEMLLKDSLSEKPRYRIVVLDSITMLATLSLSQIVTKDRADVKDTTKIKGMFEEIPTLQEYNLSAIRWINFFAKFTNLKKHIIMIARELERQNDEGTIFYAPDITGKKLPLNLGGYFSEVFRLTAKPKDGKFTNEFTCKKLHNTITKGHQNLELFETGKNGTVDLTAIVKKILGENKNNNEVKK